MTMDAPREKVETLTAEERRDIASRLGPMLAGGGLLALSGVHAWLFPGESALTALVQALAALIVGVPMCWRGLQGFLARPTRDLSSQLVALAVVAAAAYGDFVTATLVPLFMEVGRLFEERSSRGARAAIEGIRRLHAQTAHRVREGKEEEIEPSKLVPGDEVLVRPGDVIPVDGKVLAGHSSVDQAPITGESVHVEVAPGSDVFSGSINLGGLLRIETLRTGGESVLGRVLSLLREVEGSKTPALRLLDRYAAVYLPIILAVAGATLLLTGQLERAIAVLVVACPSALFLSGPVAMVAAMSACTRLSVLIKSPRFLETVPEIDTLLFDKTGTITMGALSLEDIHPEEGGSEDETLRAAATCGFGSRHPVSRAMVDAARDRGVDFDEPDALEEVPGSGVVAHLGASTLRLGSAAWMRELGLPVGEGPTSVGTGAWVARDDRVLGYVALVDRPREEAHQALDATRRLGVTRHVLLTGDREEVAERIAAGLGFDEHVSEMLPQQKLDLVRAEQDKGRRVMMVGDGVNDALALSGSDVGVAVGSRINEVALGGADVALMSSDLTRLPLMIDIARLARRIIVQNLLIVLAFGLLMIGLASAGIVSPLVGAWLHNVDALLVILNSARLLHLHEGAGSPRNAD